jgi:hypothetical protein
VNRKSMTTSKGLGSHVYKHVIASVRHRTAVLLNDLSMFVSFSIARYMVWSRMRKDDRDRIIKGSNRGQRGAEPVVPGFLTWEGANDGQPVSASR